MCFIQVNIYCVKHIPSICLILPPYHLFTLLVPFVSLELLDFFHCTHASPGEGINTL